MGQVPSLVPPAIGQQIAVGIIAEEFRRLGHRQVPRLGTMLLRPVQGDRDVLPDRQRIARHGRFRAEPLAPPIEPIVVAVHCDGSPSFGDAQPCIGRALYCLAAA